MRRAGQRRAGLGLAGVALIVIALPVQAGQLGMRRPPLLLVEVWCSTDAAGQLSGMQRRARLVRPGSLHAGLQASWSSLLEQGRDVNSLPLAALSWQDAAIPAFPARLAAGAPADARGLADLRTLGLQVPLPSLSDLQAAAEAHLRGQAPAVAADLRQRLQSEGADQAWLAFHQQVQFRGQAVTLLWNLHVLGNGYWVAGAAQLQASGTGILSARYVSKAAVQGLPVNYAYQDAGTLQWALRDAQGQPLAPARTLDMAGAFDGPAGLACLLGSALPPGALATAPGAPVAPGTCPSVLTTYSLPQLALQAGAANIELDYLDALQPAFVGSADGTRRALVALQVDRVLLGHGADCSRPPWQYRNDYQAAFQLQARAQHFSRTGQGTWLSAPAVQYALAGTLSPWRSVSVPLQEGERLQVGQLLVDPDRGVPVDLDRFAAGLPDVRAGPVRCASLGP